MNHCASEKADGTPCRRPVNKTGDFCSSHGGGFTEEETQEELTKASESVERPWRKMDRSARTPFGGQRRKMNVDLGALRKLESRGIVPRWINEDTTGQRLKDAESGGYSYVDSDGQQLLGDAQESQEKGRAVRVVVGRHEDGSTQYAYLMGIPQEFYDEDQAKKEAINKLADDAIRGGNPADVELSDKLVGKIRNNGIKINSETNYRP